MVGLYTVYHVILNKMFITPEKFLSSATELCPVSISLLVLSSFVKFDVEFMILDEDCVVCM